MNEVKRFRVSICAKFIGPRLGATKKSTYQKFWRIKKNRTEAILEFDSKIMIYSNPQTD